jgi:hypothetical protein
VREQIVQVAFALGNVTWWCMREGGGRHILHSFMGGELEVDLLQRGRG